MKSKVCRHIERHEQHSRAKANIRNKKRTQNMLVLSQDILVLSYLSFPADKSSEDFAASLVRSLLEYDVERSVLVISSEEH